ncbi:hypothetical protein [Streptomyces venezuelae]
MAQAPRITKFRLEVERQNWTYEAFVRRWRKACNELAALDREPELALLPLSRRTYWRWMNGEVTAPQQAPARVLEHLFGLPAKTLLEEQPRGTLFAALVEQRNWNYPAFANHWERSRRELAQRDGEPRLADVRVTRRTYMHWKSGDLAGLPRPDAARILEYIFGVPVAKLMDRSSHVHHEGATTVTGAGLARAGRMSGDGNSVGMQRLAAETIDSIVRRYEARGPYELAGEALLLRRVVHTLLTTASSPDAEQLRLASKAAGLLAYMAVNAGLQELADTFCAEAESFAIGAGDTSLRMWVHGTRALNYYYMGDYRLSYEAAEAGVALAPDSPQAIRLLVNGQARALARLGDGKSAGYAVARALSLSERQAKLPVGITSCISFQPYSYARTLANAITAHLSAGDPKRVLQYADEIEDLVAGSDSQWTKALVGLDVATALLQQPRPDVERAIALGQAAVRTGGARPIESVRQRSAELLTSARRWRNEPLVGEYAEELNALKRTPPPELLSTTDA